MPAPKKHKKRPSTSSQYRKAGWMPKVTLTLDAPTLARLDALGSHFGVHGRSAAIRFLAKKLHADSGLAAIPE